MPQSGNTSVRHTRFTVSPCSDGTITRSLITGLPIHVVEIADVRTRPDPSIGNTHRPGDTIVLSSRVPGNHGTIDVQSRKVASEPPLLRAGHLSSHVKSPCGQNPTSDGLCQCAPWIGHPSIRLLRPVISLQRHLSLRSFIHQGAGAAGVSRAGCAGAPRTVWRWHPVRQWRPPCTAPCAVSWLPGHGVTMLPQAMTTAADSGGTAMPPSADRHSGSSTSR